MGFGEGLYEDFAPAWMGKSGNGVEPGDKIMGKVTSLSEAWSDQSQGYYPIITIQDEEDNQPKAVHVFWTTLRGELEKWQPQIGDRIAILYKEDRPNKVAGRSDIKMFRVEIEGKTPQVLARRAPQQRLPQQTDITDAQVEEDVPY